MKRKKKKRIIPQRKRCDCGKKVLNHHWLCDKCWGDKARREYRKRREKLKNNKDFIINPINKNGN